MRVETALTQDERRDALTFGLDSLTTEAIRNLIDGDTDEALRLMSEVSWMADQQADYLIYLKDELDDVKALARLLLEERDRALDHLGSTTLALEATRRDIPSVESLARRSGYADAVEDLRSLLNEREMDTSILDELEGSAS